MYIKREVLEKIGVLDTKLFMYHEDLEYCWRARIAGYSVVIAPQATVYHHYEFKRNKKLFYWTERNRWVVLLQNYSLGTLLKLLPMLVFMELGMLGYSVLGGWVQYKLRGYVWVMTHIFSILKMRIRTQSLRTVSDNAIMQVMDGELLMSEMNNPVLKHIVSPLSNWYFKKIKK